MQPSSKPPGPSAVTEGHTSMLNAQFQEQPAGRSASRLEAGVNRRLVTDVVVLEVAGLLGDVVEDLDLAIQLSLADLPRGVVCDLSAMAKGAEPRAVEMLAAAGRHVRDWPGIPVAVACPDPQVRQALAAHPLGGHLIVTGCLASSVSAVLAPPAVLVEWLHLAPHPTAMRASRNFVTRSLLNWRLGPAIRFARLVVSELVMSSTVNTGTDIDVSVAWNLGALRLTVRDSAPSLPPQRDSALCLRGRGLAVVAGLSHAFGALPTADGGTVAWAVLSAPQRRLLTNRPQREPASALPEAPGSTEALGLGGVPVSAETGRHRSGRRAADPSTGLRSTPPASLDPDRDGQSITASS